MGVATTLPEFSKKTLRKRWAYLGGGGGGLWAEKYGIQESMLITKDI